MPGTSDQDNDAFPVNVCGMIRRGSGGPKSSLARDSDNLARRLRGREHRRRAERACWPRRMHSTAARCGGSARGVSARSARWILPCCANQSAIGLRRDQIAAADLARQAQQIPERAKENQNEARRLASAIDTLNSDRDRLYSRVTVLEQGLDSVTGAIARQSAAAVGPPSPPPQPAPVATIEASEPSQSPLARRPARPRRGDEACRQAGGGNECPAWPRDACQNRFKSTGGQPCSPSRFRTHRCSNNPSCDACPGCSQPPPVAAHRCRRRPRPPRWSPRNR